MKHLTSALLFLAFSGALAGAAGCADDGTASSNTNGEQQGERKPQVGEWETVVDALPFPLEGDAAIKQITIGRREYDENYANRGNIEVLYDHPEQTITVEIRKYVFGDELDRESVFERLSLWAFVTSGNPSKPSSQPADSDCTKDTWKNNCAIYAYYDGKSQPERAGMDFRVHLPAGFRGKVIANTEDNLQEQDTYPRRGNITIDGLCGSGDVLMEAGWAKIKMCRELTPAPTCPAAGIEACNTWPNPPGDGSEAWDKDCPCGKGDLFGQLIVRAPKPWAANITVDIPQSVWANTTLKNTADSKLDDCMPQIEACGTIKSCTLNDEDKFSPTAEFNYPSSAAPSGAGFNITLETGGCVPIPFVDNAADWKPEGAPDEELRGKLKVCTGCL